MQILFVVVLALISEELRVEVAFWYGIYLLVLSGDGEQYNVV